MTWETLGREIEDFVRQVREIPAMPEADEAELHALLDAYRFDAPRDPEIVLEDTLSMLRRWTLHTQHPRYFGLFNPSVHAASVRADALVAAFNPQVAAVTHAPAASAVEQHVLRFVADTCGYPPDAGAHFTGGGSEANLTAMVLALTRAFPGYGDEGLRALPGRPVLYVSTEAHHSFEKNAHVTGLGRNAVRRVAVDEELKLDLDALGRAVAEDRNRDRRPFMVVGTAGTTTAGVLDPLPAIADFCRTQGLWFHTDAAWGGGVAMSLELAPLLRGIELSDSVTCDAHKFFSVSMGAGMFFTRHPEILGQAFTVDAPYVRETITGPGDPFRVSLQWSRRFIGLKLFMTLAELGRPGMAERIEHQVAMGRSLRARLGARGWSVLVDTPLPLVCFTHPDVRTGRVSVPGLIARVYARRRVWISQAVFRGNEQALRACITSFRTEENDLDVLVDELEAARIAS